MSTEKEKKKTMTYVPHPHQTNYTTTTNALTSLRLQTVTCFGSENTKTTVSAIRRSRDRKGRRGARTAMQGAVRHARCMVILVLLHALTRSFIRPHPSFLRRLDMGPKYLNRFRTVSKPYFTLASACCLFASTVDLYLFMTSLLLADKIGTRETLAEGKARA